MAYSNKYKIDISANKKVITKIINEICAIEKPTHKKVEKVFFKNPSETEGILSKSAVLLAYKELKKSGEIKLSQKDEKKLLNQIRMKKIRSLSGVTPVTVLTKPFPCPGKCIFCPNDVRMPKSYLSDEPGAQRAEANRFDPYLQTFNRLVALRNMGHPTSKIELIILGGTWSHYPETYQIWFVKRCFDAMNDFGNSKTTEMIQPKDAQPYDEDLLEDIKGEVMEKTYNKVVAKALQARVSEALGEKATWRELFDSHKLNESAKTKCIGLVIETRPDELTIPEIIRIRKLGATKVQIGIQSLNDDVLQKNKRGHDSDQTRTAINFLRQAGFKIHAHWMPNLYGSTPALDKEDFKLLFSDKNIRPDELKVYPCSLIASAELMKFYKEGLWAPYTEEQLLDVFETVYSETPRYCRLTRIIRDIPGTDIVVGNKKTNFRQIAEEYLSEKGIVSKDIRAREIKDSKLKKKDLSFRVTEYETGVSKEQFMEFVTPDDKIVAFLRLSMPTAPAFIAELRKSAVIREIHVYGESIEVGQKKSGKAQHLGLGKELIKAVAKVAKKNKYRKLSVISSIGTREYYEKNGFKFLRNTIGLYQHKKL